MISLNKRIVGDSLVKPQKSVIAKILSDNGLIDNLTAIYSHIDMTQRIYLKMLFNQIFEEKIDLLQEEIEFLSGLNKNPKFSCKGADKKNCKRKHESKNYRLCMIAGLCYLVLW